MKLHWPKKDTSIYEMTYEEYDSITGGLSGFMRKVALVVGLPCATVTFLSDTSGGLGLFHLGAWTNFFGWGGLMGPIGIILQVIKYITDRDIKSGNTILVLKKTTKESVSQNMKEKQE